MNFENLTEEQMAMARNCESAEELLALARKEGVELTEEQLESVAGGDYCTNLAWCKTVECPSIVWPDD